MLGLASEGDVFVHGARTTSGSRLAWEEMGGAVKLDDISAWARGVRVPQPAITQRQPDTGWQLRSLALPCKLTLGGTAPSTTSLHVVLARGVSHDQALQRWHQGIEAITEAESRHGADDEAFWQQVPQLAGDWPEYWRRGFVYDFETLRTVMRPPVGLIPHVFDGMQIQVT